MKAKALLAFKFQLFKPCKKILGAFKFRFRRPLLIRALPCCLHRTKSKHAPLRKHITELRSVFQSSRRQSKKMNRLMKHRIVSDERRERLLFPSPITPACVKNNGHQQKGNLRSCEDVEDACRSFENYLVEMIVEEGKVRDLMDVEELLYCWKNLKCPIFIDLVCRFYGELCKDLFSPEEDEVDVSR